MRVSIVACPSPEHQDFAKRLATAIGQARNIQTEIVAGETGVFDVRVDGDLIYSKAHTGRLPEVDDLLRYLKEC